MWESTLPSSARWWWKVYRRYWMSNRILHEQQSSLQKVWGWMPWVWENYWIVHQLSSWFPFKLDIMHRCWLVWTWQYNNWWHLSKVPQKLPRVRLIRLDSDVYDPLSHVLHKMCWWRKILTQRSLQFNMPCRLHPTRWGWSPFPSRKKRMLGTDHPAFQSANPDRRWRYPANKIRLRFTPLPIEHSPIVPLLHSLGILPIG